MSSLIEEGSCFSIPDELVTLKIGPDAKRFLVHKQHACAASPVFRAAFNGKFAEGQAQTYTLEYTTEKVGRLLVHWIYKGKLDFDHGNDFMNVTWAKLWVLGDALLMPSLQNAVIEEVYDWRDDVKFFSSNVGWIYENTSKDSLLRKFYVDLFATNGESYELTADGPAPYEFLLDLVTRYSDLGEIDLHDLIDMASDRSDYYVERMEQKESG